MKRQQNKKTLKKPVQSPQWKKAILDALNHCPLIECGKDFCHDRGYYRLKENSNVEKKEDSPFEEVKRNVDVEEEKTNVSKELYSCYDDLQRQLGHCVKVFSNLYGKYLKNRDVERSNLVRDILERQNQLFDLFGKCKMCWCSFN